MTPTRTVVWTAIAGAGLALAVTAVQASAAGNPVEERQMTMKQVGSAMKDLSGLASGQAPWDAAKLKDLTNGIAGSAKKLKSLYPANTAADPKTSADPKIWTNKADFDKRLAEMGTLAAAASKATSAETFKPAFLALAGTCKSCHDLYRKKKT
ncbi:cytochrome c [Phenylobacterium sp.]|uniref:c-type cytochrome n=1 Tax=Phenylobacterium sp. TaxID=1871053 RepID=UPI0025E212DE|nr:cytochrome c [Phenylobacterium sp.]